MNRRALVVLATAALLGIAFLLIAFQDGVRRSLSLTTADPDALGLVGTTSMKPITVTMHVRRPATDADGEKVTPGIPSKRIIDRQISFKAPAAYFSVLDLKKKPTGPQRVGFAVWSDTFEPFQPDYIRALEAGRAARAAKQPYSDADGPIARRMRETGAYQLSFEVTSIYRGSPAERERVLRWHAERQPDKPCIREFISEWGIERLSVPQDVNPRESCLGAMQYEPNRVHYRKVNADGTLQFIVTCQPAGLNRRGERSLEPLCEMHGLFRDWPLYVLVDSSRPDLFLPTFKRVTDFLASVTDGASH